MELNELFSIRRSIRSFNGKAISDAARKNILRAANASPVGLAKYETLHLTVVKNPALLTALEENAAQVFQVKRSFLYGAPELIIVSTSACDNVGYSNAAIVAHDMALAAVNEGAGVCHIWGCTMALAANRELIAKLGIPDGFTPTCAVALGETDEAYAPREIPEDRISINWI